MIRKTLRCVAAHRPQGCICARKHKKWHHFFLFGFPHHNNIPQQRPSERHPWIASNLTGRGDRRGNRKIGQTMRLALFGVCFTYSFFTNTLFYLLIRHITQAPPSLQTWVGGANLPLMTHPIATLAAPPPSLQTQVGGAILPLPHIPQPPAPPSLQTWVGEAFLPLMSPTCPTLATNMSRWGCLGGCFLFTYVYMYVFFLFSSLYTCFLLYICVFFSFICVFIFLYTFLTCFLYFVCVFFI